MNSAISNQKVIPISIDESILEKPWLVGRDAALNLTIEDASISRVHAQLTYIEGNIVIGDLGSTNGSFLNGRRLKPNQISWVSDGDNVRFGNINCRISIDTEKFAKLSRPTGEDYINKLRSSNTPFKRRPAFIVSPKPIETTIQNVDC